MSIKYFEDPSKTQAPHHPYSTRLLQPPTTIYSYTNRRLPKAPLPCIVCYESLAAPFPYTLCQHRLLCLLCAEMHFTAALDSGEVPRCLVAACQAPFEQQPDSVFKQFTAKAQAKWRIAEKKHSLSNRTQSQRVFRACQRPNCEGFVHPDTRQCVSCGCPHCPHCFRTEHEGKCRPVSFIGEDLEIKQCGLCKGRLYKEGGCSRVVCPTCRRTVCFDCGEEWSYKHHGCASGGWILLPWYYLVDFCCSQSTVNRGDEIIR